MYSRGGAGDAVRKQRSFSDSVAHARAYHLVLGMWLVSFLWIFCGAQLLHEQLKGRLSAHVVLDRNWRLLPGYARPEQSAHHASARSARMQGHQGRHAGVPGTHHRYWYLMKVADLYTGRSEHVAYLINNIFLK